MAQPQFYNLHYLPQTRLLLSLNDWLQRKLYIHAESDNFRCPMFR